MYSFIKYQFRYFKYVILQISIIHIPALLLTYLNTRIGMEKEVFFMFSIFVSLTFQSKLWEKANNHSRFYKFNPKVSISHAISSNMYSIEDRKYRLVFVCIISV